MKEYIKALRLPACIFAGITTFVSFRLTGNAAESLLPIFSTITIYAAIMAQNDLRDRWNDKKKGKTFAFNNPVSFRRFTIMLWILAVIASGSLVLQNPCYLVIALPLIIIGLVYSELQQIPFISNILVALAMGLAVLYPVCNGKNIMILWLFAIFIAIAIFGREILKDFDDKEIDAGHKSTLIQLYGEENAKNIVVFLVLILDRFSAVLTLPIFFLHKVIFFEPALDLFIGDPTPKMIADVKLRLDVGLIVITLLFGCL